MSSAIVQLLVLAGVAIFLILRLRNVLGTRDGYEPPRTTAPGVEADVAARRIRDGFEVIEGGPDRDITDHVTAGSPAAVALGAIKQAEPDFSVREFLGGARGAYEMILMAFENGDLNSVKPFLGSDVYEAFIDVIAAREDEGLTVDAQFIGVRELVLHDASFDSATNEAEISVRFVGELTYAVRNAEGDIVEGDPNQIKRQSDIWTFGRVVGTDDPNWQLVATGG